MKKKIVIILLVVISVIGITTYFIKKDKAVLSVKQQIQKEQLMNAKNILVVFVKSINMCDYKVDIDAKYGKPDIRRKSSENYYEIRNIEDGSKLYVIYAKDGNRVLYTWRLNTLLTPQDFKDIKVNESTLEDVLKIDPFFDPDFCDEIEYCSDHRLINNKSVTIYYSIKNKVVTRIEYSSPDPSNFCSILKPQDLKKITP